jgi:hypothetical protein
VKKGLSLLCAVFLIFLPLYVVLPLLNGVFLKLAYAQVPQDTFSAGGVIQTQFAGINNQLSINQSSSSKLGGANNATNSSTSNAPTPTSQTSLYDVNGTWNMVVNNGNVANFKAMAIVSPINETSSNSNSNSNNHTYEISNFHNGNKMYAQLYPNGVAFIVGKSDIKEDGAAKWKGVGTALIIDKASSFKISLDPAATGNLFDGQPIQGLTTSIKNSLGMELLNNKGSSSGGPQESGSGPDMSNLPNAEQGPSQPDQGATPDQSGQQTNESPNEGSNQGSFSQGTTPQQPGQNPLNNPSGLPNPTSPSGPSPSGPSPSGPSPSGPSPSGPSTPQQITPQPSPQHPID